MCLLYCQPRVVMAPQRFSQRHRVSLIPRMPPEIVDEIIDHNHDDPTTLRACALTARSWQPRSHRNLFSTITVTSSASLSRFIRFLNGSPHIASLVEELCFDAYANYRDATLMPWIHELATIPMGDLTRIRSLRFSKVQWSCIEKNEALLSTLRSYSTVQEVHFCGCSFPTFIDFEEFVAALPALTRFSVDLITWSFTDKFHIDRMMADPPKLQLSGVEFTRFAHPVKFCSWLLRMPVPPTLQTVAFHWVMAEEAQMVGKFLASLGPRLRSLRIGCRFDKDPAMAHRLIEYIDLSQNIEMHSLHLVIVDLQDYLMPWVPAILSQVKHVPLQRLTLEIWLHTGWQLRSSVWNEIVALLDNEWVKTMHEVVVMHRGDLPMDYTNACWAWRFPGLVERHVLRVHNRSPFLEPVATARRLR